jgi:hypothetical protein
VSASGEPVRYEIRVAGVLDSRWAAWFDGLAITRQGVEAKAQMYPHGNSRRTLRLDLVRSMRPQVLEMGLASAAELDELDTAARAHLADPHTVVIYGLLFLTWGRKPGHAPPRSPQTA